MHSWGQVPQVPGKRLLHRTSYRCSLHHHRGKLRGRRGSVSEQGRRSVSREQYRQLRNASVYALKGYFQLYETKNWDDYFEE